MKTNTEKVGTDMEWVQDWTKALVAESLTNTRYQLFLCLHFDNSAVLLFFDRTLSAEMISTFWAKQRLHLLVVFWYSVAFRCMLHWIL